ncbi:hypothetical protein D9M70_466840 [compost metagenome]
MNAAIDGRAGGNAGCGTELRPQGTSDITRLQHRCEERHPPLAFDQRRERSGYWVPEIRMAAERGQLVAEHARQPVGPVLRIGEDRRDSRKSLRKGLLLPIELRADIEAHRQACRASLGKRGPRHIIFSGKAVGAGVFIVQHRKRKVACRIEHHRCRAVRGNGDGVESVFGVERREALEQERPEVLDIEMRIGTGSKHHIRRLADGDLLEPLEIDGRDLRIGLADIDDANDPHRISPYERRSGAAPPPARYRHGFP